VPNRQGKIKQFLPHQKKKEAFNSLHAKWGRGKKGGKKKDLLNAQKKGRILPAQGIKRHRKKSVVPRTECRLIGPYL